jgi:hypothetical protein
LLAGCDSLFDLDLVPADARKGTDSAAADVGADAPDPCWFREDFASGLDTVRWTKYNDDHQLTVEVDSETLAITPDVTRPIYAGVFHPLTIDLTGQMVEATVVPATQAGGITTDLVIFDQVSNDKTVKVVSGNGTVFLGHRVGTTEMSGTSYQHGPSFARWRLRHDAATNRVHFDAASLTGPWQSVDSVIPSFDLASSRLILTAGVYEVLGVTTGPARFDDIAICPSVAPP